MPSALRQYAPRCWTLIVERKELATVLFTDGKLVDDADYLAQKLAEAERKLKRP